MLVFVVYYNGQPKRQSWYQSNKWHREGDFPAYIHYYKNGQPLSQSWYQSNKWHREGDLPARIKYYENGQLESEWWYHFDKLHRESDLHAEIWYHTNGQPQIQRWYQYGKLHRFGIKMVSCTKKAICLLLFSTTKTVKYIVTINFVSNLKIICYYFQT